MQPRGPSTRARVGLILFASALVALGVAIPATPAHADVAFRKKKAPASTDSGALEGSPSGGEAAATEGGDTAATEGGGEGEKPAAKTEYAPQAEDRDKPRDRSLIEKTPAEIELERKAAAKKNEGPPIYTKWQFWAIVGGAAVGGAVAIWGGLKLAHEINGGDVRACNPSFSGCFGEGQ